MCSDKLQEYARLLICAGLNVQPGQTVVIRTPVECATLARLCAAESYAAGCKEVVLDWRDDFIERQRLLYAQEETLGVYAKRDELVYAQGLSGNAAMLEFYVSDPGSMNGVPPERLMRARQARMKVIGKYYDRLTAGDAVMCTASPPIGAWAKKMFPKSSEEDALEKLWEIVFQTMHIDGSGSSIAYWKTHFARMAVCADVLTKQQFTSLHYKNGLGTELTVELPRGHMWKHCLDTTKSGQTYIKNMPSEEIYTVPKRDGVDGIVYGSRPLVYQGCLVTDFRIRFEKGRAVEASARTGDAVLKEMLRFDENACRLGEAALVPSDSAISRMGRIFYNPLYDENASCHLALGEGIGDCIRCGEMMSREELEEAGVNHSGIHVDFMIGTEDMEITGRTVEGRTIRIFEKGRFSEELVEKN